MTDTNHEPSNTNHESSSLQHAFLAHITQHYRAALHHGGATLLKEARILHDARTQAQHGEWLPFLHTLALSPDAAERLLHIHRLASVNPTFAEAVRTNWLSPSTAALLARASTPPDVIDTILAADTPPTRAAVTQHIHAAHRATDPTPAAIPTCDPPPLPAAPSTPSESRNIPHESSSTNHASSPTLLIYLLAAVLPSDLAPTLSTNLPASSASSAVVSVPAPATVETVPASSASSAVRSVPAPRAEVDSPEATAYRTTITRFIRTYSTTPTETRVILDAILRLITQRLEAMRPYRFCLPCTHTIRHRLRRIARALDSLDDLLRPRRRKHAPPSGAIATSRYK